MRPHYGHTPGCSELSYKPVDLPGAVPIPSRPRIHSSPSYQAPERGQLALHSRRRQKQQRNSTLHDTVRGPMRAASLGLQMTLCSGCLGEAEPTGRGAASA